MKFFFFEEAEMEYISQSKCLS